MLLRGNYILFYTEFFEFLFICQHVLQPQIFSNHLLPYQIYVLDKTDIFILDIRIFMVYYTMNWCITVLRVSIAINVKVTSMKMLGKNHGFAKQVFRSIFRRHIIVIYHCICYTKNAED